MVQHARVVQPTFLHDRPNPTPLHTLQDRSPFRNSDADPSPGLDGPVMVQMHQSHARHVRFETMVAHKHRPFLCSATN
jgi:hypothetical protein